jgi:triosephosphate isomerase
VLPSRYIVANFKNHGSFDFFQHYLAALTPLNPAQTAILCPPPPYLSFVQQKLPRGYQLGAQDCSAFDDLTITGETRASMLAALHVNFVILGHSERLVHLRETDNVITQKIACAKAQNITPIICLGESEDIRTNGQTQAFLTQKLRSILPPTSGPIILAYEPLWAIGSGRTPNLEDIQGTADFLKNEAGKHLEQPPPPILYGGSVSTQNAASILALPAISGLLVGRAILDPTFWSSFCAPG